MCVEYTLCRSFLKVFKIPIKKFLRVHRWIACELFPVRETGVAGSKSHQSQRSVGSLVGTSLVNSVVVVAIGWSSPHRWVSTGRSVGERWVLSGLGTFESSPHVGLWRVGSGSVIDSWVGGGLWEEGSISYLIWSRDGHGRGDSEKGEEFHHY